VLAEASVAGRPRPPERHSLELYWLECCGGGIFVPFGDAANGRESYGPGRYVLDAVEGADLGMDGGRAAPDPDPGRRADGIDSLTGI